MHSNCLQNTILIHNELFVLVSECFLAFLHSQRQKYSYQGKVIIIMDNLEANINDMIK